MTLVPGIDISNYNGGLSAAWARACVDLGIKRATVRLSLESDEHIAIARQQIATFQAAGMETVDGYWWAYPTLELPATIAERVVGTYPGLPLYSADLEDEPHSYGNPTANIDWVHAALGGFDAIRAASAIYTSAGYWKQWMGNTDEFAAYALWVASWDRTPGDMSFRPFGGWTVACGKQYSGESSGSESIVAGVAVDRSTWDTDLVPGAQGDDSMTESQRLIVQDEILRNVDKALALKLPKEAREALEFGAKPACETLIRGEG